MASLHCVVLLALLGLTMATPFIWLPPPPPPPWLPPPWLPPPRRPPPRRPPPRPQVVIVRPASPPLPPPISQVATIKQGEVCYPPLGCFSNAEPWSSPMRPLPLPNSPDSIQTTFFLYTRDRPAMFTMTTVPETSLKGSDFSPKRPTAFVVHGFREHGRLPWMLKMKDALLKRADVNVIITDWAKGSSKPLNYLQAAANTRIVGAQIARLIQKLEADFGARRQDVQVIGFSLGGQVAAYAGKTASGLGKITALDPARPAFEGYPDAVHLTKDDALFVEVLHTSGRPFVLFGGYGMIAPHGHVDYYINNEVGDTVVGCDHERAHEVYTQMLLSTTCTFWGHPVGASDRDVEKPCSADTCVALSYESTRALRGGSYIVPTSASPPYCMADPQREGEAAREERTKLPAWAGGKLGPLLQAMDSDCNWLVNG